MLRPCLLPALAWLVACSGAPSSLDICQASCDARRRCAVTSDAEAQSCRSGCDRSRGTYEAQDTADDARCKNAGDVRKKLLDCQVLDCQEIEACVEQVNQADNICRGA